MSLSKHKRAAQLTAAAIRSTFDQIRLLRKDNAALVAENKRLKADLAALTKKRTEDEAERHVVTEAPASPRRVPRTRKPEQASA